MPTKRALVPSFEEAFKSVQTLVQDFQDNEEYFRSSSYKEQEVRKDYIDKFLIALGWDVNHDFHKNPYEQEVKVERSVDTSGAQRRADYAFYVTPDFRTVRFYVEAKKPHGDIDTIDNYFQTIRYGWNGQMPLAALTSFFQFRVLDCRYKPDVGTVLYQSVKQYHYSEYVEKDKFAEIFYLFSREAVAAGSLDNFAQSLPKRRGKAMQRGFFKSGNQSIDDSFLEELDQHRTTLAHIFKNESPNLNGKTLTEVAQRTLDRLVFIRFLEDKLIEPNYLVANFGNKGTAWQDFIAASRHLDSIYNGIVFKKHKLLDSSDFNVKDSRFDGICEQLAHINSPYDFNVIPIHVLGSIYEQFLGKVITTTDIRVRVEEKPEVRKAGGVYYTPDYVVQYIVKNTVGKLIKGKTPAQIEDMHFVDIACGSGSFLLGVYDLLLRYHTRYYNDNPSKVKRGDCVKKDDKLHLSLHKKREILLNNVFGVDIDPQAVEVAQLSLYLKLLEEETTASAHVHQLEFRETLLPSLSNNIVCGNSLIGPDFYTNSAKPPLVDLEERLRINAFDWQVGFPEIMRTGGFDAVIGNPPWGGDIDKQLEYLHQKYPYSTHEHTDSFKLFIEQSLRLANDNGLVSMIVPNTLLRQRRLKDVRALLLENQVLRLVDLGEDVFSGVVAPSCIFVGAKGKPSTQHQVEMLDLRSFSNSEKATALGNDSLKTVTEQHEFNINADFEFMPSIKKPHVMTQLLGQFNPLVCKDSGINYQRVNVGMQEKGNSDLADRLLYQGKKQKGQDKMYWKGSDIDRYWITEKTERFCRPNYQDFIKRNEVVHLNEDIFNLAPKILLRQTADKIIATIDRHGVWFGRSIIAIVPTTHLKPEYRLEYFLGILNSRYFRWLYDSIAHEAGRVFAQVKLSKLKQLPIRLIDFSKSSDVSCHNRMVHLVEQMLALNKQLAQAKTEQEKTVLQRQIDFTDQQIDLLVYELYGLTEDEIKLVEGVAPASSAS